MKPMCYFINIIGVLLLLVEQFNCQNQTEDEKAILSCNCGKENKKMKKNIDRTLAATIFKRLVDTNLNKSSLAYYPEIVRNYLKKCSTCELVFIKCTEYDIETNDYHCVKSSATFDIIKNAIYNLQYKDIVEYLEDRVSSSVLENDGKTPVRIHKRETLMYPVYVHVPIGGFKRRFRRQRDGCHYPNSLQTAELDCVHYPSSVRCTQKCAFGHTLKRGKVVEYKCRLKENKWLPDNFEECKPYIDCSVTLVTGGRSRCTTPTLSRGPSCEIHCDKYEDKEATRTKKYNCDIRGKWSPSLPFCVSPGSGLELAKIKEESDKDNNEDQDK